MTEFWIKPDECQRVLDEVRDVMRDRDRYFQHADSDLNIVDRNSYVDAESKRGDYEASELDQAYRQFFHEGLSPQFDKIVQMIERRIGIMQDVIDYYVSGDAEVQHRSQKQGKDMPVILNADGTAWDKPPSDVDGSLPGGHYQEAPYQFLDTNTPEEG
ncbi:hypothetical protein [Micrococcus terreus]|uniref:Uncharacterized protein n=1 Tax=Micrococcus terreus TaxID=574650 RepID=A0A1I7ME53_9MICC|nr:hypothetical protein [Micrococcus terreus]SFV20213.1 hypothetical protein SAMN04487966_101230 [Micrococcus terreus]